MEFAAIGMIALVAGFVHSAIGFGFGIVAISLIPLVLDVRTSHVVVSASSIPMLMMAAWTYRKGIEKRSFLEALGGAALFLPMGFFLFETVSMDWLVRGTGLAIFVMVLWSMADRGRVEERAALRGACFAAGAAAGFLGGAVSIAGPPIAAFALRQNWTQVRFKSFVTQCVLVIAAYKVIILAARGFLVSEVIGQAAVAGLLSILGVYLGALLSARISATNFKWLVAAALILVSLRMIWSG